ncbi:uncharacterized protein LOC62_08G009857 [Vanrija pseudolonga]|uniref:Uncharacterized protein n=1 Tax=Vanrija pseudolonga TaxID=143232 RepID=A0AAF0YGJ2_9TREE|nr:hypothetical protein LOC62_08G009857 [Vanrija pseudolonga]
MATRIHIIHLKPHDEQALIISVLCRHHRGVWIRHRGVALAQPGFKGQTWIKTEKCFEQPGFKYYSFISPTLNDINCVLNTVFLAGNSAGDGEQILLGVFGGLIVAQCVQILYESFRPRRGAAAFGAKLASVFTLIGQLTTIAVSAPIYFTIVVLGPKPRGQWRPKSEYIYTTLIAFFIGGLLPSLWMQESGMSFDALSFWQPFPLYVNILSVVLPVLFVPIFANSSPMAPILILTALVLYPSLKGHLRLLQSSIPLRDVLLYYLPEDWPAGAPDNLGFIAHLVFSADFTFTLISNYSWLLCNLRPKSIGAALGYIVVLALLTVAAGPGSASALVFAWNELLGPNSGNVPLNI